MSSLLFNANICFVVDCGIKDMTKNLKKKKKKLHVGSHPIYTLRSVSNFIHDRLRKGEKLFLLTFIFSQFYCC